jgi:hypothetical protein
MLQVLLPVVVGAVLGFVPNWLLEGRKNRYARNNKWSDALYQASIDLMAAARRVEHLVENATRGLVDDQMAKRLDEEHQNMRVALEQVRMLANVQVQRAAQDVVNNVYAIRVQLQSAAFPNAVQDEAAWERLGAARFGYYEAVRRQLGVPRSGNRRND